MATAEELLQNINSETEEHIVIGSDRHITVPKSLRRIAVQYDHDVETVTFDCPRYWDGLDMSKMTVYINYLRSDGYTDSYPVRNVTIDETNPNIMHFDWTISRNATSVAGQLTFLVCIKKTNDDGIEINHWNSELYDELSVSPGMEAERQDEEYVKDLVAMLLSDMVGKKSEHDGTIFNDYENNEAYGEYATAMGTKTVAGSRYFEIVEINPDGFLNGAVIDIKLDSIEGFSSFKVEDKVQVSVGTKEKHFDYLGYFRNIQDTFNKTIAVIVENRIIQDDFNPETDMPTMLWIPDYPELGTHTMESSALATGTESQATGENSVSFGTKNKSIGKHSSTFGYGNIAAFAANALGFINKALGRSSQTTGVLNETTPEAEGAYAGGNNSKAKHPFSFVHGFFLRTAAKFQAIFGVYNQPNEDALFQVGNGIHDNDAQIWQPKTAFEVLKDGSAKVQTQGTDSNSIVQNKTLEQKVEQGISSANSYANAVVKALKDEMQTTDNSHQAQLSVLFKNDESHVALFKNHQTQIDLANGRIDSIKTDQTYNPESKNAQSGKAVAEALANVGGGNNGKGTFTTIADITLTEEVNTIICADANSFADIRKIQDFYMLVTIPKHDAQISGSFRIYVNDHCISNFSNFDTGFEYKCVTATYSINIPNFSRMNISQGKFSANGLSEVNLTTTSSIENTPISNITAKITTTTSMLPVGTNIKIVGWVQ